VICKIEKLDQKFLKKMSKSKAILLMKNGDRYIIPFGIESLDKNKSGRYIPGNVLTYSSSDDRFKYTDLMEGKYYFKLPEGQLKERLKILETSIILVTNNNQRFSKGPGHNKWFVRLFFCHPELVNIAQILFVYDYALIPRDMNIDLCVSEIVWQNPNMEIINYANDEVR
jgi:hypothetical protein